MRANLVCMRDKSYDKLCPSLPPLDGNGWLKDNDQDTYKPLHCLLLPAPKAVIELRKCGCKVECSGNCTCKVHNIPCTPLCKCANRECQRRIPDREISDIVHQGNENDDDDDDDDDENEEEV